MASRTGWSEMSASHRKNQKARRARVAADAELTFATKYVSRLFAGERLCVVATPFLSELLEALGHPAEVHVVSFAGLSDHTGKVLSTVTNRVAAARLARILRRGGCPEDVINEPELMRRSPNPDWAGHMVVTTKTRLIDPTFSQFAVWLEMPLLAVTCEIDGTENGCWEYQRPGSVLSYEIGPMAPEWGHGWLDGQRSEIRSTAREVAAAYRRGEEQSLLLHARLKRDAVVRAGRIRNGWDPDMDMVTRETRHSGDAFIHRLSTRT